MQLMVVVIAFMAAIAVAAPIPEPAGLESLVSRAASLGDGDEIKRKVPYSDLGGDGSFKRKVPYSDLGGDNNF